MIAPPKGSNNTILLNASFIDTFDKYKISSKNISIIIGTIICCEKTVKTMIIIAEISFTGPFKLWIMLSPDAISSNLSVWVMSANY